MSALEFINSHVNYLNNSKFFAGCIMILLNICSKFVTTQLSKTAEEYIKLTISTQILVFAMAWMGTRDIYTALVLTAVFTVLSGHVFNEESPFCCVPEKYRILAKTMDVNQDGQVTEQEITDAISILEKARQNKSKLKQMQTFTLFGNYLTDMN